MTIQCRTSCGEQIDYERFDFPDGYIYFLPRNIDGTIHNCSNISDKGYLDKHFQKIDEKVDEMSSDEWINYEIKERKILKNDIWWFIENFTKNNSLYPYDFSNSEFVTNLTEVAGWKENQKEIELERINKEKLFHYQISCLLFPSPFSNIDESNGNDLIHLSEAYEYLRMLDCAIIARTIQNMITNDQNPKILELTKSLNFSNETSKHGIIKKSISVKELQEYIREVERHIKEFIREHYGDLKLFKEEFPQIYYDSIKNQNNTSEKFKREHNDIIEFMSFGDVIQIIKKKRRCFYEKENTRNNMWKKISFGLINTMYSVKEMRNGFGHVTPKNIEEVVEEEDKELCYLQCKQIINYFEKLKLV